MQLSFGACCSLVGRVAFMRLLEPLERIQEVRVVRRLGGVVGNGLVALDRAPRLLNSPASSLE